MDKGILKANPFVPVDILQGQGHGQGTITLKKVPPSQLVKVWSERIKPKAGSIVNLNFLFIDTEHTCGLTLRRGVVLFDSKPFAHCDARVVTTRAVFHAILIGELDFPRAEQFGMLRIEGDRRVMDHLAQRN